MARTWLNAEIARLEQELATCYLGMEVKSLGPKSGTVELKLLKALVQHKQFLEGRKAGKKFSIQDAHAFNARERAFHDARDLVGIVDVPLGSVAYVLTMFLHGFECVLVVAWCDKNENNAVIQVCYDGSSDDLFAAEQATGSYCGRHSQHEQCKFYRFYLDRTPGAASFPGHGVVEREDGRSRAEADRYFVYNNGIAQAMAALWQYSWRDDPPVAGAVVDIPYASFDNSKNGMASL